MAFYSKLIASTFLFMSISLLVGCAPDPNVPLNKEFWNEQPKQPVTIALDKNFNGDMYIQGAAGLLDIAIINGADHQFIKYLNQYSFVNFNNLQIKFSENLQKYKIATEQYDESIEVSRLSNSSEPNYVAYERKDFKPLTMKLKNNRLLLLNINSIGAIRHYYGMIPLGAPKAICDAEGRLIDLNNNRTLWRFSTTQVVIVDGAWDQPPQYPNFTHALEQAVSQANQAILNDFFIAAPR